MLPLTEKVTRTALREVCACDLEAVAGPAQDAQALPRDLSLVRTEEHAVRLPCTAADTSAQLVQLRQTEPVCVLDHHQIGVRYVHADLDNRRCDQNIVVFRRKIAHDLIFFHVFHPSVQHSHPPVREQLLQIFRVLFGAFQLGFSVFAVLYERTHDVDLSAEANLLVDERRDALSHIFTDRVGFDRASAGRDFIQHGHIEVAVHDERQRARDGRSRHNENVRRSTFRGERGTLRHAETVLLIRDHRAQPVELHTLLNERVRAHDHLCRARFNGGERRPLLCSRHRAGKQCTRDAQLVQHGRERFRVLRGEYLCRRHECRLPAVLRGQRAQARRHDRLTRADIALHQPVHRPARSTVRRNFQNRAPLCAGRRKRQGFKERIQSIRGKNNTGIRFSALLQLLQAAAEQEKLLEYHASARLRHIVLGFRPVNCRKCVYCVRQAVFRP